MRRILPISVMLAIAVGLTARAQTTAIRRVALVIGNGQYDGVPLLKEPIADATDVATKLKGLGIIKDCRDIDTDCNDMMLRTNVKLGDFPKMLSAFADMVAEADQVIVYYSGHGMQMGSTNYIQPVDSGPINDENYKTRLISVADIYDVLRNSPSHFNLVMLNACRNNPFRQKGAVWHEPVEDIPSGTIVAFATRPGHLAANQGPNQTHSPYAEALLARMGEPGITVPAFFMKVRLDVNDLTTREQLTWETTSQMVDFMFRDPATAQVQMTYGDDEIIVLVNGETAIWSLDGDAVKSLRLKPGDNVMRIFVFNQKSCRGNCCIDLPLPGVPFLDDLVQQVNGDHPREGWHVTLNVKVHDDQFPIDEQEDNEPGRPLPEWHWGHSFQLAAAKIHVDTQTEQVKFLDVEKQVWKDSFTMIDENLSELDLAVGWSVWHEGVRLYNEYPEQETPTLTLKSALAKKHGDRSGPNPKRGSSAWAHMRAKALIDQASPSDIEAAAQRVHFREVERDAHSLRKNLLYVASRTGGRFRDLARTRNFSVLRDEYAKFQEFQEKNPDALNLLAAMSDRELELFFTQH